VLRALAPLAFVALSAAAGAVVPATPRAPDAEARAPLARLSATPLERPWIEATPLAWGSEAKVFRPARPAATVALVGVPEGLTMICAGAEGRAPRCQRAWLERGSTLDLPDPLPGVRIAGRVLLGRQPAAGLRLSVAPAGLVARRAFSLPLAGAADGAGLLREVTSGADGRFATPQLAPGRYVLVAQAAGSRDAQSDEFTVPDAAELRRKLHHPAELPALDLGEWSLAEGVRVPVRVADATGAPVAGAEVAALQSEAAVAPSVSAARTGPDGRAVLSRLDAALGIQIRCSAAGFVAAQEEYVQVPAEARCTLVRRASLTGRVADDDGEPIAGATLTLERARRSAVSNAGGAFAFADLAPGRDRLVAAAPGRRAGAGAVEIAAGERRSLGVLRLSPADELFGRAIDAASGDPVAGAEVAVVEPAGGASTTTDGDGRFSLAAGADFVLRLEIRAAGFPVRRVAVGPEARTSEEAPLAVQLSRGGRVQARVWDERADAPCLGCTVQLVSPLMSPEAGPESLTTDANGEAVSELLAPGEWDAYLETAESAGATVRVHSDSVRRVTVSAGDLARVDFGRHATLRVRFSAPLPPGWLVSASGASFRSTVAAGADGAFAIRRPDGEAITLALVDESLHRIQQAVVPPGYGDPALALPLPTASVRGVLKQRDEPGQDLQVTLASSAGEGDLASAVADGRGAFQIPFVPPGIYALAVEGRPVRAVEVREGQPLDLGEVRLPN
jgi:hypothetical protein